MDADTKKRANDETVDLFLKDLRMRGSVLAETMDDEQRHILGMMLWTTGPLAHALRKLGLATIPTKAEEEQAHVIHWCLTLYAQHGLGWRDHAIELMKPLKDMKDAPK